MKKRTMGCLLTAAFALSAACGALLLSSPVPDVSASGEANTPVFYGAAEITLQRGAVEKFDHKDARFRVFARDFEDGDIVPELVSQNVDPSHEGEYKLEYRATDADGHSVTLTVPVYVLGEEGHTVTVERTVYTVGSDWNLRLAGFSRCDTGTRQILGIYLPAGESFRMRIKDGTKGKDLAVAMLNNDSQKESAVSVAGDGAEFKEIANTAGEDSVPLVTAPVLGRDEPLSTVYTVELEYDASRVHPLNYYYEGDDEEEFKKTWTDSGDGYGVIEGETLVMVVPKGDMEAYKRTDSKAFVFQSYDAHLQYYEKVVHRMDEIVGLSYSPEKPTDQNVRMKYLVKANAHGAGAAYYAGNHVGINNASMGAFFEMNWGGLHELAHGYQGYLGNGTMGLGETSNNILGHYIQLDKALYTFEADWLGKLPQTEEKRNEARLSGKKFTEIEVGDRLYAIVNLFDAIAKEKGEKSGAEVYAAMFSYYREKLQEGVFSGNTPNQEVYARFFASHYDINILPYWNGWGLEVSEETREEVSGASEAFMILSDGAGERAAEVAGGEEALKYAPVAESSLKKYGLKGDLVVTADIDRPEVLEGKELTLERDGTRLTARFEGGKATFTGLDVGSYLVRPPLRFDYAYETQFFTVNAGENAQPLRFEYAPQTDYHPTMLKIRGYYDTIGYYLTLSENNRVGTITLGGANLGNQTSPEWAEKPNTVHTSVKIRDASGNTVDEHSIKGQEPFAYTTTVLDPIPLEYGYTVEVFTQTPQYVRVVSLLTNAEIPAYYEDKTTLRIYEITEEGLLPTFLENFSVKDVLYAAAKDTLLEQAAQSAAYLDEHPELTGSPLLGRARKDAFLQSYDKLRPEDREAYDALAVSLRGHVPQVEVLGDTLTANYAGDVVWDSFDWSEYLAATDEEDGELLLGGGNVRVESDFDGEHAGTYSVALTVSDSDGNEARCVVRLVVERDGSRLAPGESGTQNNTQSGADEEFPVALVVGIAVAAAGLCVMLAVLIVVRKNAAKRRK